MKYIDWREPAHTCVDQPDLPCPACTKYACRRRPDAGRGQLLKDRLAYLYGASDESSVAVETRRWVEPVLTDLDRQLLADMRVIW